MKRISENELRTVNGGHDKYWYYWGGMASKCTAYAYASNYLAEPLAAAKLYAHKTFCSLCTQGTMRFGNSLPSAKKRKL